MKKKFLVAFFLLFLFPAFAAAQRNSNVAYNTYKPVNEPPKTTIFGRVLYEDTGKPLRRGSISLLRISANEGTIVYERLEENYGSKTITNESGEFKMEGIPPGEYYPFLNVPGVLNPNTYPDLYKDGTTISNAKLDVFFEKIKVVEGVKEMPVLIRVKRGGAIGGRISYADGEPAINAKVEILRKGEWTYETKSSSADAKTDDRGVYRFSGLPPGEYVVRITEPTNAAKENYYFYEASQLKTYYGDTSKPTEAKKIELAIGEEKSGVDITVPDRKILKISGLVIARASRKILPNASVSFFLKDEEDFLGYPPTTSYSSFYSNEKGEWTAEDLPAGTYIFSVSLSEPYMDEEEQKKRKKEPRYATIKKEVVLGDENLENVIFELPIAAKISGTVTFQDKRKMEKNYFVFIVDEEKDLYNSTMNSPDEIDDDNKKAPENQWDFTIDNVAEGNYFFHVIVSGETDFYVKSIRSGNNDLENAPLSLKEGEEVKNIQIVLATDLGTLKGKVETADGKDLKTLNVTIVSVDKPSARYLIRSVEVNAAGEFELKAAPGEYYLIVEQQDVFMESRRLSHAEWLRKFTANAEKIKIKAGETQTVTVKK